ncbi:MAG: FtsW/RodA/SpoVE family cell cycle protein [Microbacteriaceae bacterium]|nr:FtsW/RodA/SpoVE family cell cycle protein [Microbacteriaceae bacterium]
MSTASTVAGAAQVKERNLRGIELALTLVALAIGALALILVQYGALGGLRPVPLVFAGVYAVSVLAVHVTLRITASHADPILLPVSALINAFGLIMIYRIDLEKQVTALWSPAARQVVWSVLALAAAIVTLLLLRDHRTLQRYTYISMLAAIVLLLLPMVPGLGSYNGTNARLWVHLGPIAFQPSEFAKIALAVFFAGYLVQHREALSLTGHRILGIRFPRARDFGPILVVWAVSMLVLVFQHDLGTSLLYFGLFLVMLYVATGLTSWVWIGLGMFALGGWAASRVITYVQGRFDAWLKPLDTKVYDTPGGSYQLVQGLFGQANGGLFGTGLGKGYPGITPLSQSDYIWASLGEELGLIGAFAILCLYLVLISRGIRVGFAGQDDFGKLLGVGVSFVLALQVFIVIGGVTRVIPLTGLPTPFLAAGGSSLLANWVIVGLLARITNSIRVGNREAVS